MSSKKDGRYDRIYKQIQVLISPVNNPISRMATIAALLHHKMDNFYWTGFYLIDNGELHVGPYQHVHLKQLP